MKKRFITAAFCLIGLVGGFSSCSNDDELTDTNIVTIEADIRERGITTDMMSAVIDIPVVSSGSWCAAVDVDCNWADLSDHENFYSGSRTLKLVIDHNPTGADRKSTLYIGTSDGELIEIPIVQTALYKGQVPSNGNGEWVAKNGVGCGIKYYYALDPNYNREGQKFSPTEMKLPNNIFNIARIEELQKSTDPDICLNQSAYVETPINFSELHDVMMDSLFAKNKMLDATVRLECSFGFLEFSAAGEYHSEAVENSAHIDYSILRNAPTYNVVISPAEIRTFAEDMALQEEFDNSDFIDAECLKIEKQIEKYIAQNKKKGIGAELTDSQKRSIDRHYINTYQPSYGKVFSSAFAKVYYALQYYIDEGEYEEADKVLGTIDNDYGPFFISGGDFGGNLNLHAEVDTMFLQGSSSLSAELSADLQGAVNVGGSVTFTEEGVQLFRNSKITIGIYGGSAAQTQSELASFLGSIDMTNREMFHDILNRWAESLKIKDGEEIPSLASPIRYDITPIWTLFSDYTVAEYAKEYFLKKYAKNGIYTYLGILEGTDTTTTGEDLLNTK